MRNSLAGRVTFAYVVLAATLVVVTCLASIVFALSQGAQRLNVNVEERRAQMITAADALAASGERFDRIASTIAHQPASGVVVQVLDARGNLVAGPPTPHVTVLARAMGKALGVGTVDFAIPGGSVRIFRGAERLEAELGRYLLFNVPIALLAIVIAWWAARRITSGAMRPLATVTSALEALADGDFAPQAVASLDYVEAAALVNAFNLATVRVAAAMHERDQAQLELRRFVADAGHELRTPLTVIIGYLHALRQGLVADPAAARIVLETIAGEGERMRRLIDDLLTLARLDHHAQVRRELIALRDVLVGVAAALPPHAKTRVDDLGGDAIVQGDRFALHHALRNVVDNALRYTAGPVRVDIAREGSFAVLTVADDGPGMSLEETTAAFGRFYRGTRSAPSEGTGLGLAIAKTACESAGGEVGLRSSPEAGTTVALRLPLATAAALGTSYQPPPPESPPPPPKSPPPPQPPPESPPPPQPPPPMFEVSTWPGSLCQPPASPPP